MKKIIAVISTGVFLFIFAICLNSCVGNVDLSKVKDAYTQDILENTDISPYDTKSVEDIKKELAVKVVDGIETCYFTNIDYKTDNNRAEWKANNHNANTLKIAIAAIKSGNDELKDIAIKLTYYWVFNNFKNTNWWQNDLGATEAVAKIGVLLHGELNDKGQAALEGKVRNCSFKYNPSLKNHTGANLFDYADISVKSSIIDDDVDEFNVAFNTIADEITTETPEGFVPDGSFFQHGRQIQNASYGTAICRLGRIIKMISASNKYFSDDKMTIIENYILSGLRCSIHKGYISYIPASRTYTRPETPLDAKIFNTKQLAYYLDIPNFKNKTTLSNFIEDLKNKNSTFEGIKYFNVAKFLTMNIDDVYMSFNGSDNTLINSECVNNENQLGLNLSYATNTCVMDDGKEYVNNGPLWKYDYIPGTTSFNLDSGKEDEQLIEIKGNPNLYDDPLFETMLPAPDENGNIVYGGGFSEENNIACLMQKSVSHKENKFTVTCFGCEDGMVIVGSDLEYTGEVTGPGKFFTTPRTIHTTLEQCNYKGSHKLSEDGKELTHGNVVYKILDNDNKMQVSTQEITGSWQRNNPDFKNEVKPVTGNTLLAFIEHGSNKAKGYAYSIQPKSREDKKFELIDTGDSNIHAVKLPNGKVVAAFYKNGSFDYNGNKYEGSIGEYKIF